MSSSQVTAVDLIDEFGGVHAWLSNFHSHPLLWEEVCYSSAEAAFAAGKTLDPRQRAAIAAAPTPGQAKRLGRAVALRAEWDARVRYEVMDSVLQAKFTDPGLRALLTETGDALLVEGNRHHDDEWGDCRCARHHDTVGRNALGLAVMRLRAQLTAAPATRWFRVAASGHRPQHLPPESHTWVQQQLGRVAAKLYAEHGTRIAISGGALGTDLWWAEHAHRARQRVWLYQPFPQQADRWPADARRQHQRVRDLAARVAVLGPAYSTSLLFARNDWMVRDADALVAVLDPHHTRGGTHHTVQAALGRIPVIRIDPHRRQVSLNMPTTPAALAPLPPVPVG
jgi:ribA/ribD-fused uncharacterized protein